MAMESQGIQFHRLTSVFSAANAAATINLDSTCICGTAATTDFVAKGFTTSMWVRWTTDVLAAANLSTMRIYRIKDVGTTEIDIFGSIASTKTANMIVYGYESTTIWGVTDFSGPTANANIIDVTPVGSSVIRIKTIQPNHGQVSLTVNFDSTGVGHTADTHRNMFEHFNSCSKRTFAIVFTDQASGSSAYPTWCSFDGYCSGYSINAAVDSKVSANIVLAIEGNVYWSAKVNE